MSETVIKVDNLSKRYRLGELHKHTNSFREKMTKAFSRITNNAKRKTSNPMLSSSQSSLSNAMPHALSYRPMSSDDSIWALRNVSFEVKRGEILGIIGRNGAGKSTLLKILSRITKPTEGKVSINGRVGSLLEVGTGFHPELTGRENIFLNGAILGMAKKVIEQKFDEILNFAEIKMFVDTPVKRYSSGMYLRLAFAVAAHLDPEILLVDEVLAVGDADFHKKCLGKMENVSTLGRTVLFVSHNMAAIRQLCDRTILIADGIVQYYGETGEVVSKYLSNSKVCKVHNWTSPPGSERVKLLAMRIFEKKNQESLTNGSQIEVQCLINVLKKDAYVFCLPIKREGEVAFYANTYHLKDKCFIRKEGYYITRFNIPRYLLNPGRHSMGFYIADSRGVRELDVKEEDVLSIDIDDDGIRRGGMFSGNWPGPVSPLLPANIQEITNIDDWNV